MINSLSAGMPRTEQLEEEEFARVLKASVSFDFREQGTWEESYLFEDFSKNLPTTVLLLYHI